ncbi:MAG: putative ATPase [bacterium]|jgi:predicted ATPase
MTRLAEATPFVGRTRELAHLRRAFLAGHRVVTLRGSAGSGKTRLAQRYASFQARHAWVDAAEARDADTLGSAVQEALGVEAEAVDGLAAAGRLLVVLDNLEQVAEVAAQLLPQWREAAPDVRFLITSRTRLKLPEEQVVPVGPMPINGAKSDAARLFASRAMAVCGRDLLAEDADAVIELVKRLDGLPLALALAAGRTPSMGPREILERIGAAVDPLHDDSLNLPDRQATLQAAIAWSWDLLDEDERSALVRCGVFAGDFDLQAAEAVLGPHAADAVQALCDDSLVHVAPDGLGGVRYRLYEAVRDFVRPLLDAHPESADIYLRHAEHFASVSALSRTLAWTAHNRHHLFAILQRCGADRQGRTAFLAATVLLARVPHLAGTVADQRKRLTNALANDEDCPVVLRVRARLVRAILIPGDTLEDAFSLVGDDEVLVSAIHARRATVLLEDDDRTQALTFARDGAAFSPTDPDVVRELARVFILCDRPEDAEALLSRLHPDDDDVRGAVYADLARIAVLKGDLAAARARCLDAIELLEGPESVPDRADAHRLLAAIHWLSGELPEAAEAATMALDVRGWRHGLALALRAALGDTDAWQAAHRSVGPTAPQAAHQVLARWSLLVTEPEEAPGRARTVEGRIVDAIRTLLDGSGELAAWVVGAESRWVRTPHGEELDLSRRGAMRRILDALVERRVGGGQPLETDALFTIGWPDQAIRGDSAAHRVRVAVSSLRMLGLSDIICKDEDGYSLATDVPIRRDTDAA